jgi:HAD superfamily hydrolase (TIGR01509 family)
VGAVVFDCDGVLADTEPHSRAAWLAVLAALEHPAGTDDVLRCTGIGYPGCYELLAAIAPLPDPDVVWRSLLDELVVSFAGGLHRYPDAVAAVEGLVVRGIPVAVASSSPRERLDLTLAAIGVAGRFDTTVAGDEVAASKPAPDVYLEAARRLGVPPRACVAVEDSGPGAAAASAAGMRVVGVAREPGETGRLLAAGAALVSSVDADELARWVA